MRRNRMTRLRLLATGAALGARIAHEKHGIPMASIVLQPAVVRSLHKMPVVAGVPSLPAWLPPGFKKPMFWVFDRVADRCVETERWATAKEDPQLATITSRLVPPMNGVREALVHGEQVVDEDGLEVAWQSLQDQGREYRERVLERVAAGGLDATEGIERLDAVRGARRVAYHAWRIAHHLNRCRAHEAPSEEAEEMAVPPHAEAEPPEPD